MIKSDQKGPCCKQLGKQKKVGSKTEWFSEELTATLVPCFFASTMRIVFFVNILELENKKQHIAKHERRSNMINLSLSYKGQHGEAVVQNIHQMLIDEMFWAVDSFDDIVSKEDIRDNLKNKRLFGEYLSEMGLLPPTLNDPVEACDTYLGLLSLLLSDETLTPTLTMEYILAKIIEQGIEAVEDIGADEYSHRLQEDIRADVYKETEASEVELYRECEDCESISDEQIADMIRERIDEVFFSYEHFSEETFDICFDDSDYELLDEIEIEVLRGSHLDQMAGILPPLKEYFVIPDNWWESKDFRYFN